MVAGSKVKLTMGFQKPSPATPKPETPKRSSPSPSSAKSSQKAVFSRSFGVYFPRSSAQVQPRPPDVAELLRLVEELRERESHLKTKIIEQKLLKQSAAIVPFLENEISSKNAELEVSVNKIESLESENERLRREMENLQARIEDERRDREKIVKEMEEEILELKKTISERNGVVESKLICNETGDNEVLSSSQRFTGLIDSSVRLNLLRNLKRGGRSTDIGLNHENQKIEIVDPKREMESERIQHQSRCNNVEEVLEISESVISTVQCRGPRVPNPPPRPSSSPPSPTSSSSSTYSTSTSSDTSVISDSNVSIVKTVLINLPPAAPPPPPPPRPTARTAPAPPPPPPPRPMGNTTRAPPSLLPPRPMASTAPAPPPPPPLPIKGAKTAPNKVKRVPEVVEFYHSLMRRDSKKESGVGGSEVPAPFASRDMIGEIENRSTHLLAIKTDVETQGDFIRFLIKEVESAAFTNIEDVVAFVKWLDDELSHLVDERAVLKHFEWPEQKADALREAAFGYCDLKKLEKEASTFSDDIRQPCGSSLKKMQNLLEKLEHGVYNLSRTRESATNKYRGYRIPTDWMLESGFVNQIKLVSVKLAMKYMQRVSLELEVAGGAPELEELMLQGVRFAFRVHQFAGGFDVETMTAFQELRNKSRSCHIQCQNQQQQKLFCRSTTC